MYQVKISATNEAENSKTPVTVLLLGPRLFPNKYFRSPRRAKAKKLGAQQVMFWELLQKFRRPKDFPGCPRLLRQQP